MATSSYLERPIRRYEEAILEVEKVREAGHCTGKKEELKKKRILPRQRPAA